MGQRLEVLNQAAGADVFTLERIALYFLPPLAFTFLQLTRIFERKPRSAMGWWLSGAVLLLLAIGFYEIPPRWAAGGFLLLTAGWGFFSGAALLQALKGYRERTSPLHRNRHLYWTTALILVILGQVCVIFGATLPGCLLHAFGLAAGCYVQLTHQLPDLRSFARRSGSYIIIVILTVVIYSAGYLLVQSIGRKYAWFQPIFGAVSLALVMALLINPLLTIFHRKIGRSIKGMRYDPRQMLSEYSMRISNILDLEYLAMIVVGLISEAMEISHGALVIVHRETGAEAAEAGKEDSYTLRLISGNGQYLADGQLPESNPVISTLRREHKPLAQYDIDLLARFKEMEVNERAWLDDLGIDVYVPIYSGDTWIGILALGPKTTGERYYNEDLSLLQTLADQTAIALENARLYEDLKQRNTENEILNAELKEANKELARLDEAKSDFINIASHELRTPLTQVIGYNDILSEMAKAGELTPKNGKHMIDSVRKAAHRLEEIVETMFDVSKLESRTFNLANAPASLTTIINNAIAIWSKGLQERKQTVTVHGVASLPVILCDSQRLTQVFANLIQNAIKSTPDGGHIRISGRLIEPTPPGQPDSERCVELVVEDNGIGIAQDELERIFQKFYRVGSVLLHSSGDTKFQGAGPGLGLTIARGIVEAHGGRIWAESLGYDETTCPGAKFFVTLPVKGRPGGATAANLTPPAR